MNWPDFALGAVVVAAPWALKELFVPDLLDRWRQGRTEKVTIGAEQRANEREDAPVRERIIAVVLAELKLLQRIFLNGTFTIEEWQDHHERVASLVDAEDAARSLGKLYQPMVQAVAHDKFSIGIQRRQLENYPPINPNAPNAADEIRFRNAETIHNAADAAIRYTKVLATLSPQDAQRYEDIAVQALGTAQRMFGVSG